MKRTLLSISAVFLAETLLAGCGSQAGNNPQPNYNPISDAVSQANVATCNAFGSFLINGVSDTEVYDVATGGNGITSFSTPAYPALQALITKWYNNEENFYGNNAANRTTGPSVEKIDHLITVYTNAIVAWCSAHAGINLAGVTSSP
jgi:hypothetical protein